MASDLNEQLRVLNRLFEVFELFSDQDQNACQEGCATCCTRNVTMTGLEGKNLLANSDETLKPELLERIRADIHKKRLVPKSTVNRMAKLCMTGEEVPDEESDPAWGACPLLEENRCLVYSARPFACRCMVSKIRCEADGVAEMDDWQITLNNIIMQYIEHIDQGGVYGNLSDILLNEVGEVSDKLIGNLPVEMLMAPPEHRERVQQVLEALRKI